MNIVFLQPVNEYWLKQISSLEKEFPKVNFYKNFEHSEKHNLLKDADAVICGRLSEEDINLAEKLKAVFVPFTGLDNFPVELLQKKGIMISNTHINGKYVAEKAVALALTILGRIIEFHEDLKKGKWNLFQLEEANYWFTIQRKTCAVLGYGEIGQNIGKYLKGFDCRIIAYRININEPSRYADEITNNLNEAISKSEIIFVCLPLTAQTKGIISKDILKSMKGKYLINVGRGDLVDEEGLYTALKDGILAGAGLDVWYNYPGKKNPEPVLPSNYPIYELKNVVISPHKSGLTKESIKGMINDTVNNIRTFIKTGKPERIVKENY